MKSFLAPFILLFSLSNASAWTQVANCGTGDAVAGVDVFTDGQDIIVQILSQDDEQAPEQYKTTAGDLAFEVNDLSTLLSDLYDGKPYSFVLAQDDSYAFGGMISSSALLNLTVHTSFSYDHNTKLAYKGIVLSLFCNRPILD